MLGLIGLRAYLPLIWIVRTCSIPPTNQKEAEMSISFQARAASVVVAVLLVAAVATPIVRLAAQIVA